MIRFILERKCLESNGLAYSFLFTLDAEVPELEQRLTHGGSSEDHYDFTILRDAEVVRKSEGESDVAPQ